MYVCACMCVCVCVHMCVCMCVCVHACTHVWVHASLCVYVHLDNSLSLKCLPRATGRCCSGFLLSCRNISKEKLLHDAFTKTVNHVINLNFCRSVAWTILNETGHSRSWNQKQGWAVHLTFLWTRPAFPQTTTFPTVRSLIWRNLDLPFSPLAQQRKSMKGFFVVSIETLGLPKIQWGTAVLVRMRLKCFDQHSAILLVATLTYIPTMPSISITLVTSPNKYS